MWHVRSDVQEEGRRGIGVLSQKVERGLCDQVVEPSAASAGLHALGKLCALVGSDHDRGGVIAFDARWIPRHAGRGQAKPRVEPVLHRVATAVCVGGAQMPLADQAGRVVRTPQQLGHRHVVRSKRSVRGRVGSDGGVARVATRHEGVARRRAGRVGVQLLEDHAAGRERIQMRRRDLGRRVWCAAEAHVAPSEVVRQDEDDVGRHIYMCDAAFLRSLRAAFKR